MSLYQKASLVQIPSGYKAADDKLYSVVPNNGDGDFTVSVDADATRVNKDGLIESVVADQARLNYDFSNPQDPHLLLEPSRTNNILQSNDPSGANWTDPLGRWTLLTDTTTAPDGGTVRIIELTESGGSLIRLTGFSIAAATYTVSFYIKDIDGNLTGGSVDVGDEGSGVPSPAFGDVGSDWVRATRTITTTATKTHMDLQPTFSGSTNKVAIWGVQLEAGSYATSLIPTSGSAVTRTKDRCTGGGDDNLFNDTEGVLFVDLQGLADVDATNRYITLSDGSATNAVMVQYRNSGDLRLYNGGTGSANLILSIAADLTERKKIAIQYGTNANDYKVYINGVSQTISGSFSATSMSGLDRFRFDYVVDNLEFFGKVYQAMVFNEALSDTELITLTS